MGRAPRIAFPGALYHVMSRGNRQGDIFHDDHDRLTFLDVLEEACGRTGWIVHAYVLMNNHYHLLIETPEPNLVDGMRWIQGTYTKRFNTRHKLWGHLLQGRYKALVVDPSEEYFRAVGNYVHLNPARAHCFDLETEPLETFRWSSYPHYLIPETRPAWLDVNRLLGALGLTDDAIGRSRYEESIRFRVRQLIGAANASDFDNEWAKIRRGWAFGDRDFKAALQEKISDLTTSNARYSYSGKAVRSHDEHAAEQLLSQGLSTFSLSKNDLPNMKKSDPRKKVIAWLIRSNTSIRNQWISEKLHMGTPTNLSHFHRDVADATEGVLFSLKTKLLNNRTDTIGVD